jgi:aminoglycoside phosphotransferase (APT) family kinase protein
VAPEQSPATGADPIAGARTVREEDAFDVEKVAGWLRAHADDPTGLDAAPEVRQFSGGASNLTYLLRYPGRDLVLRRPPAGQKARGAHDMAREFRIQASLAPVFPYVPVMVALREDESVIGSPFYVMERLTGHIPRKELPPDLQLTPAEARSLCLNAVDLLVELHTVDVGAAGLGTLGKGEGYVARQVGGWSARYRKARTWNVGSFETVMAWLDRNQPEDRGTCLIHNDFRLDNLVLSADDPTRPVGLLDWEMATVGDPLMDLGGALAYWVQADDGFLFRRFRRQPTHVEGMLTRREVVDHYCSRTGQTLTDEQWAFYEVFGLFRLAVICQQIYYRYHHRQTRNPAFRLFGLAVVMLELRCRRLIRRAR